MSSNLNAIGIICKDIKRSISFYTVLGLSFTEIGEGHYEGSSDHGLRVMLDSIDLIKKINPEWKEGSGGGIVLCFNQSTVDEVDIAFSKLVSEGYETVKSPWNAFWGQRYASIKDPDGNQIDLFSDIK